MSKNKSYCIVYFVLTYLISLGAFAQQEEYISGRLFDSKTNEPVVFANIRIKDRALGIITNVDGSFKIPLIYKEYGDIIEISSMGYETKEMPITEFILDKLNIVKIDPGAIGLQEAVVRGKGKRNLSAKQIVRRAIKAIPKNYPITSFSTIGYYRDYQFREGDYLNLNEGILEVFDEGFDQIDDHSTRTRIFNFGLNPDFKEDSLARMAYDYESNRKIINRARLDAHAGNEFRILRTHDAIRNHKINSFDFVNVMNTDFVMNHTFKKEDEWFFDDELLYEISFTKILINYRVFGKIYISKNSFAIRKMEYTMYDKTKWNKDKQKDDNGVRNKVIFDITTEYKKENGKMYLSYISFNNSFEVRKPPKFVLDSTLVNAPGGYCMLYFNKPVDSISAKKPRNYGVQFNQRKFGIEKIEVLQDSVKLYLEPSFVKVMNLNSGKINTLLRKQRSTELEALFEIDIKKIEDVDGNVVNESEILDYQQFREFFVQRVKPDSRAPIDDLFMDKRKPIFEDQPVAKPKDYREYWMNTPLIRNSN